MRSLGSFLRDAWHLARPYYAHSQERWSARLLLAAIIALNLFLVGMDVVLNFWNGAFYDSLQNKDWHSFLSLLLIGKWSGPDMMPGFSLIAAVYILVAVYRTYLNQWLQIRWRRWLTGHFMDQWLADRAYYRISLNPGDNLDGTDNPDQRISDDLASFTSDTLAIGLDLLSNVVSLFSFVGILWALSGPMTVFGYSIPGYLVWVALVYAVLGSWLTHLVGRPLAVLRFRQQRVEADFRFALVRLRENTEGIALYAGEDDEKSELSHRFSSVVGVWWQIMRRVKFLNALTAGYNQVATIFPIVVAAPRYFSGAIALGGLTRIASAFGQVQGSLSWLVGAYASIASWRATVERLANFHRAVVAARAAAAEGPQLATSVDGRLEVDGLTLRVPNGEALAEGLHMDIGAGEHVLLTGRSGSGKTTLFRALAGIWPFGEGVVRRPEGSFLFLPQRPYIPLGTLRHAVTYPVPEQAIADADVAAALRDVGLGELAGQLDNDTPWALRLSGGEQQRLAFARALLVRPDWLFLDEATANLDPEAEHELYSLLRKRLTGTTIVSIAHRPSVATYHERHIALSGAAGLVPVPGE